MKAIVIPRHGGPEVLEYKEVAEPRPGPDDVVVRVRACALNHLDLWMRKGIPGVQIALPRVPGSDIAGEVAAVGDHVSRVQVGQKAVLLPGVSCQACDACAAGRDNECRHYSLLGAYQLDGGCAEYVRAPAFNVLPLPEGLGYEEAAAVPLVFQTAWHMLMTRAQLKPGEDVLVLGAGSGVGSAAIQIARLAGARLVITTAGSEAKLAKAKELGADALINHSTQDFAAEVKKLTGGRGVDVIFEHVGAATWEKSLASLTPAGRLVTCGATTGPDAKIDIRRLFVRQWSLLGSFMGTRPELVTILKLVERGRLRPVVDRVYPLSQATSAHAHLENREQFGKVVLKVE
jgi:NADPH:quinone reductase-like Zn-dependent oxidoreductase